MIDEGLVDTDSRKFGLAAFLRKKQWWSFEGLDEKSGVYFVFLAMQSVPTGYVSLTVLDLRTGDRLSEEFMCPVRAEPGDRTDVTADGKWGRVKFGGSFEQFWLIEVRTRNIEAKIEQKSASGMHRNRLQSNRIDYALLQSIHNEMSGEMKFGRENRQVAGWGYFEHAWGVQPRLSRANWMHFWSPGASGVVLDCRYDQGVPHHYTYLVDSSGQYELSSPAKFQFDPRNPDSEWIIESPDMNLSVSPLHVHRTVKKIPPVLPYININYIEILCRVAGAAETGAGTISIDGFGKYDWNINRW